jgi:outer membrane protein assembly factor BamA
MNALNCWNRSLLCRTAAVLGLLAAGLGGDLPETPRMLVSEVLIQGTTKTNPSDILARIKTRPGSEFSERTLQEDVRTLIGTRLFAEVTPHVQPDGEGRVKVIFEFRDFPSVVQRVGSQGAGHLEDDELP